MPEYLHPGVYIQEESSGAKPIEAASTSTAAFVGTLGRGRPSIPVFLTSWPQFEREFGGLDKRHHLPLAAYHFFLNGGKRMYAVRVINEATAVVATGNATIGAATVYAYARGKGNWATGTKIAFVKEKEEGRFQMQVTLQGSTSPDEIIGGLGTKDGDPRFYATIINRDSKLVELDFRQRPGGPPPPPPPPPPAPPPPVAVDFPAGDGIDLAPTAFTLTGGVDGSAVVAGDYSTAMSKALDRLDDISILVVPGASGGSGDIAVANAAIDYADGRKNKDLICVLDSPGTSQDTRDGAAQISDVKDFRGAINKSAFAALYFPWVAIPDPYSSVAGATRFAPPSGMVAGLFARTDNSRGVWKAPAGTEANLRGTVGLGVNVSDEDQDALNPISVNCIRNFPATGNVVWGARTLSPDPEWRYVPVRRFASFLSKSLFRGTQWIVFEPNDEPLWSAIRFNLNAFMTTLFRQGALQGSKPGDAFFVKCDSENNIQATIDQGQVHILVGFAPLKPAEFVIIHIQQIRKE